MLFGQWTQLRNAPFVNHHSNGFGINGKAYIVQGFSERVDGQEGNMLWEYTPETDTWTSLGLTPAQERGYAIGDDMNGKFYFGFGFGRQDVWEFDPETMEYTELPPCPGVGRGHPALVAHNNKLFMGSGSSNNGDLNDWWVYDFATETWDQKANMPGPIRHHPYQFGIDDAIYVGGGHRDNWLKWNITDETWEAINNMPGGRVAGTQFSYKGKGFLLSGDTEVHDPLTVNNFMMYVPEDDDWIVLPFENSMQRWAGSSFIIGEEVYYFGGWGANPGGNDNNMWKFDLSYTDCLSPSRIMTTETTENTASLFWSGPTGATDHFQYREVGDDWITVETTETTYQLDGLSTCTDYEYRVHTDCGDDGDTYSEIESFTTKGCGACVDLSYCSAGTFITTFAYLDAVTINSYKSNTGNNDGYASFTNSNEVEVGMGGDFDLTIEPVILGFNKDYSVKVWMDTNVDGSFQNGELLLEEDVEDGVDITRTLTVADDATLGINRLRIIFNLDNISSPCNQGGIQDGEVEDYCLTVVEGNTSSIGSTNLREQPIKVFPNPFGDNLQIDLSDISDAQVVTIENIQGITVFENNIDAQSDKMEISNLNIPSGVYILRITSRTGDQVGSKVIVRK